MGYATDTALHLLLLRKPFLTQDVILSGAVPVIVVVIWCSADTLTYLSRRKGWYLWKTNRNNISQSPTACPKAHKHSLCTSMIHTTEDNCTEQQHQVRLHQSYQENLDLQSTLLKPQHFMILWYTGGSSSHLNAFFFLSYSITFHSFTV